MPGTHLRTIDLARAAGLSVQQVRNYEAWSFIPPAERSASGYRLYTPRHLAALTTARSMIAGYGWQIGLHSMQAIHAGNLPAALTLIDKRHAELASKRLQIERTLDALRTLSVQSMTSTTGKEDVANGRGKASDRERAIHTWRATRLRVGEAARRVGVRASALHFWEQQGLLHPTREKESNYRLYDEQQMRRLQVIVLLREANYDFSTIRSVLDELASGRPEQAIQAVEKRSAELARSSWACVEAMAAFHEYVRRWCPDLIGEVARQTQHEATEHSRTEC